jgi:hypothetical protein
VLNSTLTAIILYDEEEELIPDERQAIFYAAAELAVSLFLNPDTYTNSRRIMIQGELVPLVLHPVLEKYLLKVDITTQPVEHDFDLPMEEITSPASDPPIHLLRLENHQGYPQLITVQASSNFPSIGVTVQDVLRTIQEDLRMLSRRREWTKLGAKEQTQVDIAFRDRCRTEEELSRGLCRVDYLQGRDRLKILPKLSPTGEILPACTHTPGSGIQRMNVSFTFHLPPSESTFLIYLLGMNQNVAGPSRIPIT